MINKYSKNIQLRNKDFNKDILAIRLQKLGKLIDFKLDI